MMQTRKKFMVKFVVIDVLYLAPKFGPKELGNPVEQAWANRRSQIFLIQKKINQNRIVLSIYGRSYLIYLIIGTQIGTNFTGESCKLCFKTIIGKILSKKNSTALKQ